MRWAELFLVGIMAVSMLCSSVKIIEVSQLHALDDEYAYLFEDPVQRNAQGHLPRIPLVFRGLTNVQK